MKKAVLLAVLILLPALTVTAQPQHRAGVNLGLQSDWYSSVEADYHWMAKPWLGFGGGLRLGTELADSHLPNGTFASGEYESWEAWGRVSKSNLKLSALFSPDIIELGEWKFGADIEPGILLGIPHERMEVRYRKPSGGIDRGTVSADGGQWIAWEGSIGLRASFRRLSLGVGYGISNYDAYSTARLLGVNGTAFDKFYPERTPVVQRAFVYTSIMF